MVWSAALLALTLAAALGATLGAALLAVGLRGRRVGDHPTCRRCGFDLTGLPASSANCPECGADVSTGSGVRVGHRRPRRGLIAAGLVVLVPTVLIAASAAGWVASDVGPTLWKPAWLLVRETAGPPSPTVTAALAELTRRSAAGGLSAGQVDALTDRALDTQADGSTAWDAAWGEWVESAQADGRVSDERWRRYARQAVAGIHLIARPRLATEAERLSPRVMVPPQRVAKDSRVSVRIESGPALVDGMPARVDGGGLLLEGQVSSNAYTLELDVALPTGHDALVPGGHRISIRPVVRVFALPGSIRPADDDVPFVTVDTERTATFEVLPSGESSVTPVDDPASEAAMLSSVGVTRVQVDPGSHVAWVHLKFDAPPVAVAVDVFLRDATGREWRLEPLVIYAGWLRPWFIHGTVEGLPAGTVDVVLRPSRAAAEGSFGVVNYWGRPIVFRHVPVRRKGDPPRAVAGPMPAAEPGAAEAAPARTE